MMLKYFDNLHDMREQRVLIRQSECLKRHHRRIQGDNTWLGLAVSPSLAGWYSTPCLQYPKQWTTRCWNSDRIMAVTGTGSDSNLGGLTESGLQNHSLISGVVPKITFHVVSRSTRSLQFDRRNSLSILLPFTTIDFLFGLSTLQITLPFSGINIPSSPLPHPPLLLFFPRHSLLVFPFQSPLQTYPCFQFSSHPSECSPWWSLLFQDMERQSSITDSDPRSVLGYAIKPSIFLRRSRNPEGQSKDDWDGLASISTILWTLQVRPMTLYKTHIPVNISLFTVFFPSVHWPCLPQWWLKLPLRLSERRTGDWAGYCTASSLLSSAERPWLAWGCVVSDGCRSDTAHFLSGPAVG